MKRGGLVVVILVVVAVLLLALRKGEPPKLPFAKARLASVVSSLPTNGRVEPLQWQAARAEIAGIVTTVPIHQGQAVAAGAVLARIDQPGAGAQLRGAQARTAQYQSDLDTLRRGGKSAELSSLDAQIAKAQFDRDQARRDVEALGRLEKQQAATRFEVQTAQQKLDAAELAIKTLQQRRTSLVSPADVNAGRARVAEGQAEIETAREQLANGIVTAPISGIVYDLPARPGAYVDAGALIAQVGNLDQLRVKVFVDEPELGRVHPAQKVKITWDGLPGLSWEGAVERVPTEVVSLNTRQVGEVWVTIQNVHHDLVPGATVNAEIQTGIARDAVVIPKTALRRDRGPIGVYVLKNGKLEWQPVTTGIGDVSNTAIQAGVKAGDLILLPTDVPVHEGDRARAVIE